MSLSAIAEEIDEEEEEEEWEEGAQGLLKDLIRTSKPLNNDLCMHSGTSDNGQLAGLHTEIVTRGG